MLVQSSSFVGQVAVAVEVHVHHHVNAEGGHRQATD
jgi:hypothetical protein